MEQATLQKILIGSFSWRRLIQGILTIPLLCYLFILFYAAFAADSLIFQPPPPSYTAGEEYMMLPGTDGGTMAIRHLKNPNARFTILFSHGNAEDLGDIEPLLQQFYTEGFSVLSYDYNGYGQSAGVSSEKSTYENIERAYRYLRTEAKVPPEQIILLGRSLGSGPSVELASRYPVGGVILQSPFTSAFRVITKAPLIPFDKFDNLAKIGKVSSPVLLMHGTGDVVVPITQGQRLFEAVTAPKQAFWVDGAGHDDLIWVAGSKHWQAIDNFAKLIGDGGDSERGGR